MPNWQKVLSERGVHLGGEHGPAFITKRSQWLAVDRTFSEAFWVCGTGNRTLEPFDVPQRVALMRWLVGAHWLLRVKEVSWEERLDSLLSMLRQFGDVTELQRPPRPRPRFASDGNFIDEFGFVTSPEEVLRQRGYRIGEESMDFPPSRFIAAAELVAELALLKHHALMVQNLNAGRPDEVLKIHESLDGSGNTIIAFLREEHGDVSNLDLARLAVRLTMYACLSRFITPRAEFSRPDELVRSRFRFLGQRPLDYLWLGLAVGCGLIEPFPGLEGVQICAYDACPRRVFSREPRGTRGEYTFCSARCGKSFHAAKRMAEKRAVARAERAAATTTGSTDIADVKPKWEEFDG